MIGTMSIFVSGVIFLKSIIRLLYIVLLAVDSESEEMVCYVFTSMPFSSVVIYAMT